jgi:hypothetical protein
MANVSDHAADHAADVPLTTSALKLSFRNLAQHSSPRDGYQIASLSGLTKIQLRAMATTTAAEQ